MKSTAKGITEYLENLPPERREVIEKVRKMILKALPKGYEEQFRWGMLSYEIPLSRSPNTYNKQPLSYAALAAQKNNYSLYLMCVYSDSEEEKRLRKAFEDAGKKLDMGKSCVRFKKLEDIPLEAIGEIIASKPVDDYIALYESTRGGTKTGQKEPKKKTAATKPAAKTAHSKNAKQR